MQDMFSNTEKESQPELVLYPGDYYSLRIS